MDFCPSKIYKTLTLGFLMLYQALNGTIWEDVAKGKTAAVIAQLDAHPSPSINMVDSQDKSLLHYAVEYNQIDIIEELLNRGISVDAPMMPKKHTVILIEIYTRYEALYTDSCFTALHSAVKQQNLPLVKLLITKGKADINARTAAGATPLHLAVLFGNSDITSYLMSLPDINKNPALYESNQTPLHLAARDKRHTIIEMLYAGGAFPQADHEGNTPLLIAAGKKDSEAVARILNYEKNVDQQNNNLMTALHLAVMTNDVNTAALLLDKNASPYIRNQEGKTAADFIQNGSLMHTLFAERNIPLPETTVTDFSALFTAINQKDDAALTQLLMVSANVNSQDENLQTPLHRAIERDDQSLFEKLLASPHLKVNLKDKNGNTPLLLACNKRKYTFVELLLKRDDLDVNCSNKKGQTALYCTAVLGDRQLLKLLLKYNAKHTLNLDVSGEFKPLDAAIRGGHRKFVRKLLAVGAKNKCDNQVHYWPMHFAAEHHPNNTKLLKDLVTRENVNAALVNGQTLLHTFARKERVHNNAALELLLSLGANKEAIDCNGRTPLVIASEQGNDDTIEFLAGKGCDLTKSAQKIIDNLRKRGKTSLAEKLIEQYKLPIGETEPAPDPTQTAEGSATNSQPHSSTTPPLPPSPSAHTAEPDTSILQDSSPSLKKVGGIILLGACALSLAYVAYKKLTKEKDNSDLNEEDEPASYISP